MCVAIRVSSGNCDRGRKCTAYESCNYTQIEIEEALEVLSSQQPPELVIDWSDYPPYKKCRTG